MQRTGHQPPIAVLISGRGSNLGALISAARRGDLAGDIALVISNRHGAEGLRLAEAAALPRVVVDHRDYDCREAFDAAIVQELQRVQPHLICLAGFMRILTPVFTDTFSDRTLNIHPSLLPDYPGLDTHQRAIDAKDSHGGASVHYVTGELDGGPVVLQSRVPIERGDDAQRLALRVLDVEHHIFPMAAQWHISGRLQINEGRAWLDGELLPPTGRQWQALR